MVKPFLSAVALNLRGGSSFPVKPQELHDSVLSMILYLSFMSGTVRTRPGNGKQNHGGQNHGGQILLKIRERERSG
jgi:hypothetical protein